MATVVAQESVEKPRQNWILNSWLDYLFIIGTPILALLWAVGFVRAFGPNHGPEAVWLTFMVFNIGHHLPTFIRIYGDMDLLKRFRWQLILGPVIPFSMAMYASWIFIAGGASVRDLMFIQLILLIWDPWHFVMQHYGFMRIYDRPNLAPRKLAGRMDLLLCMSWFVFIMLSAEWLPDLLYKAHMFHGFDFILYYTPRVKAIVESLAMIAAVGSTIGYLFYLAWCKTNNYYISWHKIALMVITFGIMFLTYVKNPLMDSMASGWTFYAGFATLGMVHVTQYLAIVWKYNNGLAKSGKKVRPGLFQHAFAQVGVIGCLIAVAYVVLCLIYGMLLRDDLMAAGLAWLMPPLIGSETMKWFNAVIASTLFTSTLLHYYYDGFIWKIRHKENQVNLSLQEEQRQADDDEFDPTAPAMSWWEKAKGSGPGWVFFKHLLYFAIPIGVLMWSNAATVSLENQLPYTRLRQVSHSYRIGLVQDAEVKKVFDAAKKRLKIEKAMASISPKAKHFLYVGDLIEVIGTTTIDLRGLKTRRPPSQQEIDAYIATLKECADYYQRAIDTPGSKAHRERPFMMNEKIADQTKRISDGLAQIQKAIEQYSSGVPPGGARMPVGPGQMQGPLQTRPGAPDINQLNPLRNMKQPKFSPLPSYRRKKK